MANLANGLKNLSKGWNAYKVTSKTAGFHRMKMRMKMNKLSNTPALVGRDEFGNRYYEDTSESFGRNRWVEYRAPNKKVSQSREDGAVHGGTTDHGFDASQVGPQWHGWLHYMADEKPGTLTGYDGKLPSYTLAHAALPDRNALPRAKRAADFVCASCVRLGSTMSSSPPTPTTKPPARSHDGAS